MQLLSLDFFPLLYGGNLRVLLLTSSSRSSSHGSCPGLHDVDASKMILGLYFILFRFSRNMYLVICVVVSAILCSCPCIFEYHDNCLTLGVGDMNPRYPKGGQNRSRTQAGHLKADSMIRFEHLRPAWSSRLPPTDQSVLVGQDHATAT